jgi:hypothetical protein
MVGEQVNGKFFLTTKYAKHTKAKPAGLLRANNLRPGFVCFVYFVVKTAVQNRISARQVAAKWGL